VTGTESISPAPWNVEVTGPAMKGFRRLPRKAATAIGEFVTGALAGDPHPLSKPLTNELLSLRTARRGDYRVLFTLDLEEHVLYVHRIEHRSDVYTQR
jgi:mRNA-degrading endonuclease RelE of RelBE toxin-antitoxin system